MTEKNRVDVIHLSRKVARITYMAAPHTTRGEALAATEVQTYSAAAADALRLWQSV